MKKWKLWMVAGIIVLANAGFVLPLLMNSEEADWVCARHVYTHPVLLSLLLAYELMIIGLVWTTPRAE
jgi:hypothetical protein